jgi:hypothetical protein
MIERKTLFYVFYYAASALLFYVVCEVASSNHLERTAIIANVKTLTAADLRRAYQKEDTKRFLGSVLNISGIVMRPYWTGSVGAALPQEPAVELKTGDPYFFISLMFDRNDEDSVFALVPGQRITVQGRCTNDGSVIVLRESKFISK